MDAAYNSNEAYRQPLRIPMPPSPGLSCFKSYDIRGRVPNELNEDLAYGLGRAMAAYLRAQKVVIGRDVRYSSPVLAKALTVGLLTGGANVFDLGLCGTEEVYFATARLQMDGGVMVTGSHNPAGDNGMKLVRQGAAPISGDSGLQDIADMIAADHFPPSARAGTYAPLACRKHYIARLRACLPQKQLRPLRIVVNAGNGCAGPVLDALEPHLPFRLIKIHHQPDGRFPNGIPNPLLPENRASTTAAVRQHGADLGVAWDGDFDRCFLFDEQGNFIEGYYLVGLLAEILLARNPGERIIHDPRLTWNTVETVRNAGGLPVQSKTGHAFIKERMRQENALYGGEMSAHHYFRDFAYCDSGMIPWLLLAAHLAEQEQPLSALLAERQAAFPCSGEINFRVDDPAACLERVLAAYRHHQPQLDYTDGLSAEFPDWRFNLRSSNTEPLLRLNIETRSDRQLLQRRTTELCDLLSPCPVACPSPVAVSAVAGRR
jgi:phosphomannomutase